MQEKTETNSGEVAINLVAPPAPWGDLALQQTSYLLKDLESLGQECIGLFIDSHPLITVKSGRNHVVVGQFRTWRLHQLLTTQSKTSVNNQNIKLLNVSKKNIGAIAGTNLFIEGLIGTLERTSELQYLANIYKNLAPEIALAILPNIKTEAQLANLLGFSRSSLYSKSQPSI